LGHGGISLARDEGADHRDVWYRKSSRIAELAALGCKAVDTNAGWCKPQPDGRQCWRKEAIPGGRVTDSSGGVPRYTSTSTRANCPVHAWLRVEEGRSAVSTLGFPCLQNPGSAGSGSYHAPVDNCATPGRTASSIASPARQAPRSLKIRTRSP